MLLEGLKLINIGLRFGLELLGLFIFGYWGFKMGDTLVMKWCLACGTPIIVAVIWGLFGSPQASYQLSGISHLMLEILIFLLPCVLLLSLGYAGLGLIYGIMAVVNRVILYIGDMRIAV
ncbi:YrdB family protein [Bacillus sp. S/N-304-OC-R1]|uniref:YrdB family protein n=1 Tax=Bacillus sp. S/N-304-OC-R1 TaxID=2758034 RepID=UPI001C8E7D09|nr:YrdB family protein [Bacillus sp. S/N-304-OC-R1]MBY0122762.1 YrdB family protein [Bacillus sp. S/N-304-OC-R1]